MSEDDVRAKRYGSADSVTRGIVVDTLRVYDTSELTEEQFDALVRYLVSAHQVQERLERMRRVYN